MDNTDFVPKSNDTTLLDESSSKSGFSCNGFRHRHSLSAGKIDELQLIDDLFRENEHKLDAVPSRVFDSLVSPNGMQDQSSRIKVEDIFILPYVMEFLLYGLTSIELDYGGTNVDTNFERGDNDPYSFPPHSAAKTDLKSVSPWFVHSSTSQNPFYEQKETASRRSVTETIEAGSLDEFNSSYSKVCKSVSELSLDQDTNAFSKEAVFTDNSKLIENSLKSFPENQATSEEAVSESSDEVDSSDEPLFDSTQDLITAEANRLIHLNLENPYFLLRFFKLAQKIRSDYHRQKLLLCMETMTSSEYSRFFKTRGFKEKNARANKSPKD